MTLPVFEDLARKRDNCQSATLSERKSNTKTPAPAKNSHVADPLGSVSGPRLYAMRDIGSLPRLADFDGEHAMPGEIPTT